MTLAPARPATDPTEAGGQAVPHTKATAHARNSRLTSDLTPRHIQHKPSGAPDPTAHLTPEDVEAIGRELDALRTEVMDSRGAADAAYIRKVIKAQRLLQVGSRAVLLFSGIKVKGVRPAWWIGTAGLSVAKILENMEIGHNVMHGQWDWMRDPKIHSTAWEWDNASPGYQWQRTHNEIHHTFTNVLDRDNDLGYGILRVDQDQPWNLYFLGNPVWNLVNAAFFEYSIAAYDLDLGDYLANLGHNSEQVKADFRRDGLAALRKIGNQMRRDYLVHPLLAAPFGGWASTLGANAVANLVRNVWTNTVIICGHFPEGVATFEKDTIEGETRGEWYLRQMVGSANITGSPAMHLMTGNLSYQIEHHLFPDMPSNRYQQIGPRVRELMDRYDLPYCTGSLTHQVGSVYAKLARLSLPAPEPERSRGRIVADELRTVGRSVGASLRRALARRR